MFDFEGTSRSAKEMSTLNTPNKVTSQREKERETCIYLSIGGFIVLLQLTGCFRSSFPSIEH
jgi:hypothetical protein